MKDLQSPASLSGCRVLVVEDEYFLAQDIVQLLDTLGAKVVGVASDVKSATAWLDGTGTCDMAVLDINLHGEMSYSIAEQLRSRAIPFVFTSGYDISALPENFHDITLLQKPIDEIIFAEALTRLVEAR